MRRRDLCRLGALALLPFPPSSTGAPEMQLRAIEPTGLAYAQACEVSDARRLLFISGQVPEDENGIPTEYADQYRLCWRNIEKQLRAAGMSFDNLVKATIFLSERKLIAQSAGLRQSILGERSPAITIVLAGIYDQRWLLEIEAIAAA
jgi:2-iminobutanoate/2-iminopropanoate deaminase